MKERDMRIVFGKLNYTPDLFSKNLLEVLKKVVTARKEFEYRNNFWVFGDLITNDHIIAGRLGKYKSEEQRYVYDKRNGIFIEESIEKGTAKFSNFVVAVNKGIIAFEDRSPIITPGSFINIFTKFSEYILGNGTKIEIGIFVEKEEIMKIIATFDIISRARLSVIPANPIDDKEFKRLQEILIETKSKKGAFEFENPENGLKVEKTIIEEGIALSEKGYGSFKLTGEKGGKKVVISSKDKVIGTFLEKVPDDIKEIISRFLNEIQDRFR